MKETLLHYYDDELNYLRKQGESFAKVHPKIAGRLRLGTGSVEDPFVGRLLESFAFLTARLRYNMDRQLGVISEGIINNLYPHYLMPVPCATTIQLNASNQLDKPTWIPKGTRLVSETDAGQQCHFTLCYPVQLAPITLTQASLRRRLPVQPKQERKEIKSCLSLYINSYKRDILLAQAMPNRLRLFINKPAKQANQIYELLLNHVIEIQLAYPNANSKTVSVPVSALKEVGFNEEEGLLPYPPQSFLGYRLMTEFFNFQEKFHYIDIMGLGDYLTDTMGNNIEFHFLLNRANAELEKLIDEKTFVLHCAPIVNVFEQIGEPIKVDQKQDYYHIIADGHRDLTELEIYQVKALVLSDERLNGEIACLPFFGKKFSDKFREKQIFWSIERKSCTALGYYHTVGYEIFANFSMTNVNIELNNPLVIMPKLLCTNRELPNQLPFGGDNPKFAFWDENYDLVNSMHCVTAMTKPTYRQKNDVMHIDMVAHISLNQLLFADNGQSLGALKELLSLYYYDSVYDHDLIAKGIVSVTTKRIVKRHPDKLKAGYCHGYQVCLTLDEDHFADNHVLLFASVVRWLLTQCCSVNAFVQLILETKQRGEVKTWPIKLGVKQTL